MQRFFFIPPPERRPMHSSTPPPEKPLNPAFAPGNAPGAFGRSSRRSEPKIAFTLIEALVVIAIIGLLGALLVPAISSANAKGMSVACSSNLRQIGVAITLYASDNRGTLPGPLMTQQRPRVSANQLSRKEWHEGQLSAFLAPYIDTLPDWKRGQQSLFACPSWARQVKGNSSSSYKLNQFVWVNGVYQSPTQASSLPWGYSGSSNPGKPGNISDLYNVTQDKDSGSSSSTWLLKDADAGPGGIPYDQALPSAPVHGRYRNALFYDLHVGRLDLLDIPL